MKQSRAKLLQSIIKELVYGLSIGDISGDLAWPVTYVFKVMFSVTAIHKC